MEKVKLTREQAEALEKAVNRYDKDLTVVRHAERYLLEEDERKLTELTTVEIAKALYIGYEVEETFKVGDLVKCNWGSGEYEDKVYEIVNISSVKDREIEINWLDNPYPMKEWLRHATPEEIAEEKQRRWWASHGREVWELRKGDVIEKLCSPYEFEAWEIVSTDGQYIYAKNFNKINPKTAQMDVNYKVICFAEDRKDKGGDIVWQTN